MKISQSLEYDEHLARLNAGLSYAEWVELPGSRRYVDPDEPTTSKCDLIMVYRLEKFAEAVMSDAQTRKRR